MSFLFNIDEFITESVTLRPESLFKKDIEQYEEIFNREIRGKSALVIGGAGTIGASFIKALLQYDPGKLVVVDINENGLTELVRDCRSRSDISLPKDFKSYPINFGDEVFQKIFEQESPFDIVANFAAHKHVRSEKDIFSIEAMMENNVFRAKRLLDCLVKAKPKHFFCVSTDKAANPVNIMGASKKLMEEVILAYSKEMCITTARFANVAFSNGSLPLGFVERVMKRQPLSCPSDVRRFFVSPKEAGEICLLACILGESGDIFFPKLDPEKDMVNFLDIVPPFLNKLGFQAEFCDNESDAKEKMHQLKSGKYPVYSFVSSTSGEKLYEEFYTDEETIDLEKFHSLGVIKDSPKKNKQDLEELIAHLKYFFSNKAEKADLVDLLKKLLPDFNHIETGVNLDQKM